MINRTQYEARKRAEIERLEWDAEVALRTSEQIYERIAMLEAETFEEAMGDAKYDEWKARRHEL